MTARPLHLLRVVSPLRPFEVSKALDDPQILNSFQGPEPLAPLRARNTLKVAKYFESPKPLKAP